MQDKGQQRSINKAYRLFPSISEEEEEEKEGEDQARTRSTNSNFWVQISSGGVGVFCVKGWVPKISVRPSKPRENIFLGWTSQHFCRDIPGVPKKLEQKKFVFVFGPRKEKKNRELCLTFACCRTFNVALKSVSCFSPCPIAQNRPNLYGHSCTV